MYRLYTGPTPNGWKISIMLEELGVPYEVRALNLMAGEQKKPEYTALNPNARIPTLVDTDNGDFTIFESGAILIYLAEKHGRFLPQEGKARSTVLQWIMFQMSGVGPMQGQCNVFFRYWQNKIPEVIERYQKETRRLYEVLEKRLEGREYLCDDYSIADICTFPWIHVYKWAGLTLDGLPNLKAWRDRLRSRAAVERGLEIPGKVNEAAMLKGGQSVVVR